MSGVSLFAAPVVSAPQVVVGGGNAVADPAPAGTDTIIVQLATASADPVQAAIVAIREATIGVATTSVTGARLIGPDTVAVTLDARLSDGLAHKVAKAAARQAGVRSADRSLTFVPASNSIPDYEWNLAPVANGVYGVDAARAWQTTTGKGIVVGVVDTGIAANSALPATAETKVTHINGSAVVGTTGPNIAVTATRTGDTVPLCNTTSDDAGAFTCGFNSRPADTDVLTVTATDTAFRTSTVTVEVGDASTPKPTMEPSNGTRIDGTAEAGASVTITYTRAGAAIGTDTTTADSQGVWSMVPTPQLLQHGDEVTAVATDPAGNVSDTSDTLTIDAYTRPPTMEPSNGTRIDGTAEAGASVTITYTRAGTAIGTATTTAESNGKWTITPDPPLENADTVTAIATDTLGNISDTSDTLTIDAYTRPPTIRPTNGKTITGTAEAHASVTLIYTRNGEVVGTETTTVGSDGSWSMKPSPELKDGDVVTGIATDSLGNVSNRSWPRVVDAFTPAPTVDPSNGRTITGTAEARAKVVLTYARDGETIGTGTTTARRSGRWSISPSEILMTGDVITAVATDTLGNVSLVSAPVTIDASTSVPTIDPSNGKTITGTSEADAGLALTYARDGDTIGTDTAVADSDGNWSAKPSVELKDGDTVTVIATDPLNNVSEPASLIIDAFTPAPTLEASTGKTITGTAEAGGSIALTYTRDGDAIGTNTATAQADGTWTVTPSTELKDRDVVTAIATDLLGNTSDASSLTIDAFTQAPTVEPSDGTTIAGTAEAGARLSLTYTRDGDAIGTDAALADSDGTWSVSPSTTLQDGDVVTAIATDALGNLSEATSLTIEVTVSAQPEPSDSPSPTPSDSPSPAASDPTDTVEPDSPSTDASQPVAPASDSGGATIQAASAGLVAQSSSESGTAVTGGTNLVGTVLPGRNFFGGDTSGWVDSDPGSHGTHVAGILAASGLNGLPAGVAPAVQIEPLRAMNSTEGTMDAVIEAIYWGIGITPEGERNDNLYPVDVLNLSIQTRDATSCPTALQDAIDSAVARDVVVVAAAGNYNASISTSAPANCKNVIVATASTASGDRAGYSSWGTSATASDWLVAAPGGSGDGSVGCDTTSCPSWILSEVGNTLVGKSGTSMAAPHVAGVAALLESANPGLTPSQIARIIRGTATPMHDGCPTAVCGSGIVNAAAAVAKATNPTSVTPVNGVSAAVSLAMSGTAQVGAILRAGPAADATSYTAPASYQWLRSGAVIPGETASSYRLVGADYGKSIAVRATTAVGGTTATSSGLTIKAKGYLSSLKRPAITGTYKVKKTLKTNIGSWSPESPAKATYQWYRGSKKIKKATKASYKLTKSDRGKKIKVKVTVTLTGYYTTSAYSASHKIKR